MLKHICLFLMAYAVGLGGVSVIIEAMFRESWTRPERWGALLLGFIAITTAEWIVSRYVGAEQKKRLS